MSASLQSAPTRPQAATRGLHLPRTRSTATCTLQTATTSRTSKSTTWATDTLCVVILNTQQLETHHSLAKRAAPPPPPSLSIPTHTRLSELERVAFALRCPVTSHYDLSFSSGGLQCSSVHIGQCGRDLACRWPAHRFDFRVAGSCSHLGLVAPPRGFRQASYQLHGEGGRGKRGWSGARTQATSLEG